MARKFPVKEFRKYMSINMSGLFYQVNLTNMWDEDPLLDLYLFIPELFNKNAEGK